MSPKPMSTYLIPTRRALLTLPFLFFRISRVFNNKLLKLLVWEPTFCRHIYHPSDDSADGVTRANCGAISQLLTADHVSFLFPSFFFLNVFSPPFFSQVDKLGTCRDLSTSLDTCWCRGNRPSRQGVKTALQSNLKLVNELAPRDQVGRHLQLADNH